MYFELSDLLDKFVIIFTVAFVYFRIASAARKYSRNFSSEHCRSIVANSEGRGLSRNREKRLWAGCQCAETAQKLHPDLRGQESNVIPHNRWRSLQRFQQINRIDRRSRCREKFRLAFRRPHCNPRFAVHLGVVSWSVLKADLLPLSDLNNVQRCADYILQTEFSFLQLSANASSCY